MLDFHVLAILEELDFLVHRCHLIGFDLGGNRLHFQTDTQADEDGSEDEHGKEQDFGRGLHFDILRF